MAWKKPPLKRRSEGVNEPRSDEGVKIPCIRMVRTITTIPTSANVLALANYSNFISPGSSRTVYVIFPTFEISRYSVRGYAMPITNTAMATCRFAKSPITGTFDKFGHTATRT